MLIVQAISHQSAENARLTFMLIAAGVVIFGRQLLFAIARMAIILVVIATVVGAIALAEYVRA